MDIRLRKAREEDRYKIALCVARSFEKDFALLSKSPEKIARTLAAGLNIEKFFIGEDKDRLVATIAVSDLEKRAAQADKESIRREYPWLKSWMTYKILQDEFERSIDLGKDMGFIEFVSTDPDYRGRGIAYSLLDYAINNKAYKSFILDVNNLNTKAISLYKKYGFREVYRKKEKYPLFRGYDQRVYMEFKKLD